MTYDNLVAVAPDKNLGAFLHAIRLGEGTSDEDGYRRIVGGELFDDFSRHPFDGTGRPLVLAAVRRLLVGGRCLPDHQTDLVELAAHLRLR